MPSTVFANGRGVVHQTSGGMRPVFLDVCKTPSQGRAARFRFPILSPSIVADGVFVLSGGLNIHFNSAIQLKTQLSRVLFAEWLYESTGDPSIDTITQIYSRLVMAF